MSTPHSCELDALLPPLTALTALAIDDTDPPLPPLTELIGLVPPGSPLCVASCCECFTAVAQLELDPSSGYASPPIRFPATLERTGDAEDSMLQFEMSTDEDSFEPPQHPEPPQRPPHPPPPPPPPPLPPASLLHIWADPEAPAARMYPRARGFPTPDLRARLDSTEAELSILRNHLAEVTAAQDELKEYVERIGGALVALEDCFIASHASQNSTRTRGRPRGRGGSGPRGGRGRGKGGDGIGNGSGNGSGDIADVSSI